ncbi:unnamed protein product [Musa banksii]
MKGGVLEVLLVSAEDLKHLHLLGSSKYYVILQCGNLVCTSKIKEGEGEKVWWNEKFTLKLSSSEWKNMMMLKLRIMKKDKFCDDRSVGDAIVYLRGVLKEGSQKGCLELKPAPYNVVLEDGTYKGEVKVGLKLISDVEMDLQTERRGCTITERQPRSIYRIILNYTLQRIPWARFLFLHNHATNADGKTD